MKIKNIQVKRVIPMSKLKVCDSYIHKKLYDLCPDVAMLLNVVIEISSDKKEIKFMCIGNANRPCIGIANNMESLVYVVEISELSYSFLGENPDEDELERLKEDQEYKAKVDDDDLDDDFDLYNDNMERCGTCNSLLNIDYHCDLCDDPDSWND